LEDRRNGEVELDSKSKEEIEVEKKLRKENQEYA